MIDSAQEDQNEGASGEGPDKETKVMSSEGGGAERVREKEEKPLYTGVSPQDVPDGAQISKAFDTLCNIVRDRMRKYKRPEPIADFYTKGRYVLVTGDGSYPDPCFYTSTPSAGHIFVTIRDGMMPPYESYGRSSPPPPQPIPELRPLGPTMPSSPTAKDDHMGDRGKDSGGKAKHKSGDSLPRSKDPSPVSPPRPKEPSLAADHPSTPKKSNGTMPTPRVPSTSSSSSCFGPDSMTYEKVEVVESVEKISNKGKTKGYEETSVVVETMIEKSSKKKH